MLGRACSRWVGSSRILATPNLKRLAPDSESNLVS